MGLFHVSANRVLRGIQKIEAAPILHGLSACIMEEPRLVGLVELRVPVPNGTVQIPGRNPISLMRSASHFMP